MSDVDARGHETAPHPSTIEVAPGHVHTVPTQPTRAEIPCPECGKTYRSPAGLGRHRSSVHGVLGKHRQASWRRAQRQATAAKQQVKQVPEPEPREDLLDVDDVFTVVVDMLFPGGEVPTKAMMTLIRWRADTQRMINEVTGAS